MKASIVICTYNRQELLSSSIVSLLSQSFPVDSYEIVVVDNNSTDFTRQIVEDLARISTVPVRYVFEERQGLSFARNRGITEAVGDIVVFTDDDIEAGSAWLEAIVGAFSDPDVAAAGGPIKPLWDCQRPLWLSDRWLDYLSISDFDSAKKTGYFKKPDAPWGVNMAFRRDVFSRIGLFSTNLGRQKSSLLSGEEYELFRRIHDADLKIVFARDGEIKHKVIRSRLQKGWFYRRSFWQGCTNAVVDISFGERKVNPEDVLSALIQSEKSGYKQSFDEKMNNRYLKGYIYQTLIMGGFGSLRQNKLMMYALQMIMVKSTNCNNPSEITNNNFKSSISILISKVMEKCFGS